MVLSLPRVPKTRLSRTSGRSGRRGANTRRSRVQLNREKPNNERHPTMKNVIKLILVSSLLAGFAWAKSNEQAYVESYAGRADVPVPISVVKPVIDPSFEGAAVRLSFIIEADGTPKEIYAPADADRDLVKQLASAVAQWKFKPLTRDGAVVRTRVILPIRVESADAASSVAQR